MTRAPTPPKNAGVTIHQRIRERREALGLSLQDVATSLDVSWQTVQHWEKKFAPKRTRLGAVAAVLQTSVEWLVSGEHEPGAAANGYSQRGLALAKLYDSLPADLKRIMYAQAQALLNPADATDSVDVPLLLPTEPQAPAGQRPAASHRAAKAVRST